MSDIYESPWAPALAAALAVLALVALARAARHLRGRDPREDGTPLATVRGIRAGIVAVGCASVAAGIATRTTWAVLFGLVFIGEELLETGIMLIALRAGNRAQEEDRKRR